MPTVIYKRNHKGQFIKGFPHGKGKILSEEGRRKLSEAARGTKELKSEGCDILRCPECLELDKKEE